MAFIILMLLVFFALIAFLFKKSRLIVLFGIGTAFVALSAGSDFLPSILLKNLQVHEPLDHFEWQSNNTIILLGGGLVQWPLGHRTSSTLFANSRVHEAARLYFDCKRKSEHCTILASGGDPRKLGISEAEVMKRELLELGVSESNIILEQKSNNTYQNAQFSNAILSSQKSSPGPLVLVSSGGHMRRSLLYFSHFGIHAVPAPSDYIQAQKSWLPLSYNFFLTDLALHEYEGILRFHVYNLLGWNRSTSAPGAP